MGMVVAVENVSLDGVMQSPAGPDEDTRGGFDRGGWAVAAFQRDPEAAQAAMAQQGGGTGAMLFGRRTYFDVVGHWLATTEPNPFTAILRDTPKYVASRTRTEPLPYPNSTLLTGDVLGRIAELKRGEGDLVVLGSGTLVRDLAATGLLDRYVLSTIPVVVGTGMRLFGDTYLPLRVLRSVTSRTGIVTATYEIVRDA